MGIQRTPAPAAMLIVTLICSVIIIGCAWVLANLIAFTSVLFKLGVL